MIALSIRQPWAWLILHAGKDIENREWKTTVRGRVLIHASKGMTHDEYEDAQLFVDLAVRLTESIPPFESLQRGGVVGSIEIVDCVKHSSSPWFSGASYGFVLRNPQPLSFVPYRGQLGFFDVPDGALQ